MPFETVPTPCVGICSTTYGDIVCRGCRRYLHEVVEWNRYSAEQKRLIWHRLDGLLTQVMPRYFEIIDAQLLRQTLDQLRLSYRFEATPWTWLQILLKNAARQLSELTPYGVRRLDTSAMSLYELKELMNAELHTLASAYYERDLLRALQF